MDVPSYVEGSDRILRMMAHLDSGAELDGRGRNWVPYLEMYGGFVEPLEVPQTVEWSDEWSDKCSKNGF